MKIKWCVTGLLLFILCAGIQLRAQQASSGQESFEDIKTKAEKGDAQAESILGYRYSEGKGVKQDYAEAVKWLRKATDQGDAAAQFNLAYCYREGKGVTQDYAEAVKLYRKAADQGFAQAQYNLGVIYFNGEIVPKDYTEGIKYFRKAAEQGFALAQYNLGVYYRDGQGLPQDFEQAMKWFRMAAGQKVILAQYNVGFFYEKGQGVLQDYAEAVKWYLKAGEQGDAQSQAKLGFFYCEGIGATQNDLESYFWSSLAAAQGINTASRNRDIVAARMSRAEIIEGQRRAAAFVPHKQTPGSSSDNLISQVNPTATGTGFFITDDGYLISNYHVVKDATKVRLLTSAGTIDAKVVQVDAANDLALLKADGKFSPLPIAASRSAHLGGTVATIGFPDRCCRDFRPSWPRGKSRRCPARGMTRAYFQISVPVQPGNSGGALVDERGNVIGIVSAKLDASTALAMSGSLPENVNYAVKSSLLLSFLESVPDVESKLKTPNTADEKFEEW